MSDERRVASELVAEVLGAVDAELALTRIVAERAALTDRSYSAGYAQGLAWAFGAVERLALGKGLLPPNARVSGGRA